MVQADPEKPLKPQGGTIRNSPPLYLIVGEHKISPCDHEIFRQFQLWVARTLTGGKIDSYRADNVSIDHWDARAGEQYPYLLNPCECGTYLPMEVPSGPMFSSAIGLLSDLNKLRGQVKTMPPAYEALLDAMMEMAGRSLETNTALEIR